MAFDITDSTTRYRLEALGSAEELLELLDHDQYQWAWDVIERNGPEAFIETMTEADYEEALSFLSKTPKQREKPLSRLNWQLQAALILRARYLALLAASGLETAEDVIDGLHGPYRKATSRFARAVVQQQRSLEGLDLLPSV